MSDTKPPSMTCGCLKDIVFGPASTIEALGRPTELPDARDVVIGNLGVWEPRGPGTSGRVAPGITPWSSHRSGRAR